MSSTPRCAAKPLETPTLYRDTLMPSVDACFKVRAISQCPQQLRVELAKTATLEAFRVGESGAFSM
jgi:hypothetical protein